MRSVKSVLLLALVVGGCSDGPGPRALSLVNGPRILRFPETLPR